MSLGTKSPKYYNSDLQEVSEEEGTRFRRMGSDDLIVNNLIVNSGPNIDSSEKDYQLS